MRGTLNISAKELVQKGYINILNVSKLGIKPSKPDFVDVLDEINKAVDK
jgi:hypothetical protein